MSDSVLRDAERAFALDPTPSAKARLINARLRSGILDINKVGLAAFLGDEAARQIVHVMETTAMATWTKFEYEEDATFSGDRRAGLMVPKFDENEGRIMWCSWIEGQGLEVVVRVALAACRPLDCRMGCVPGTCNFSQVFFGAEAWLKNQTEENRLKADTPVIPAGTVSRSLLVLAANILRYQRIGKDFREFPDNRSNLHLILDDVGAGKNTLKNIRDEVVPWALGDI